MPTWLTGIGLRITPMARRVALSNEGRSVKLVEALGQNEFDSIDISRR